MKKTLLFSVALAGLMLGSCSSSDDLNGGGNTGSNQSGNGYVAFNINLPSQAGSSSRAGSGNDQFDDGTPNEYDVKDATLLIFEGPNESSATFKSAYKLNTAPWDDKKVNGNVTTTSATIVKEIDAPASSSNCYALVILNNNGVFKVDESNHKISFAGETGNFVGDYAKFATSLSDKDLTKNGFYMANSPLSSVAGGTAAATGADITTLVKLEGKIKETEADAKSSPAQIFVERGVAKVTMQNTSTVTSVAGSQNSAGKSVDFKLSSWALDNINKQTYLVRSTDGSDKWLDLATTKPGVTSKFRFVGSNSVASGVNLFRTYFAKDANYSDVENTKAIADGDFKQINAAGITNGFGKDNPLYCFENTFDVDCQRDQYTTRVLIKAALNSDQTFFVINGDENTIFDKTEVEKVIKKYFLTEYKSWIQTHVTGTTSVNEGNLNVTISDNAGAVTITSIEFTGGASATTMPTDYQTTVMNRIGTIQEYKNGEAYYFVRIKHFGDDLTPWKDGESSTPNSTDGVYPAGVDRDNNYLGRYGVLRNNWYDIVVDGVKGLGFAEVPDVTNDPDDELKSYIAVQINVLSWAKRTQGAILH